MIHLDKMYYFVLKIVETAYYLINEPGFFMYLKNDEKIQMYKKIVSFIYYVYN